MQMVSMQKARKDKNLSQKKTADLLGVAEATYHRWETRETDIPHTKFLHFCEIVEREPNEIFLDKLST